MLRSLTEAHPRQHLSADWAASYMGNISPRSTSPILSKEVQTEYTPPPPNPDRDLTAAMEAPNPHRPRFTCCQGRQ